MVGIVNNNIVCNGITNTSAVSSLSLSSAGNVSLPANCSFLAVLSSTVSNATGDGTIVTLIANSEIYDIGSNYNNATGVFTAPVTGQYWLTAQTTLNGLSASFTGGYGEFVTSNRTYRTWQYNIGAVANGTTFRTTTSVLADMDAGDTATVQFSVSGSTKTVGVFANTGLMSNHFSGILVG